jgi:hypothetical protein
VRDNAVVVSQVEMSVVRAVTKGHPSFVVTSPADRESLRTASALLGGRALNRDLLTAEIGVSLGVGANNDGGYLQQFYCELSTDGVTSIGESSGHNFDRKMTLGSA